MKLTENQAKALQTLITSVITAILLFLQTVLTGCVSAKDSTVNQNNDFSVPIYINPESYELSFVADGVCSFCGYTHAAPIPEDDDFHRFMRIMRLSDVYNLSSDNFEKEVAYLQLMELKNGNK